MSFSLLLSFIFLITSFSFYVQWPGLYGPNGLLPIHEGNACSTAARSAMTLTCFHDDFGISLDGLVEILLFSLVTLSLFATLAGTIVGRYLFSPVFALLWFGYSNIVTIGDTFTSFQWDILLMETAFLSIFAASNNAWLSHLNYCYRFLAFKLMFLSGIVKLQAQCPTWENLTALEFHFATQCIPTPLAWFAHQMPPFLLR